MSRLRTRQISYDKTRLVRTTSRKMNLRRQKDTLRQMKQRNKETKKLKKQLNEI